MKKVKSIYLNNRFFVFITIVVFLFIFGYAFEFITSFAKISFFVLLTVLLLDFLLLFRVSKGIKATRFTPDKLSNGDENEIRVLIENNYNFPLEVRVIDELPFQFQKRDFSYNLSIPSGNSKALKYSVRPVKRGEYSFGALNIFAKSKIGFVSRRYQFSENKVVPVYPSYIQMRKYELMAISNNLKELGIKKIRRIGHNMEFEQVKEYIQGDDFRTINWKATARKNHLMVNNYQDEKSQQVYSIIDKGRVMRMPFEGMSLLDYAINASLVISNIAIKKGDKAGLVTFQHRLGTILPASRRNSQMHLVMETLYNQKTAYKESDYSILYTNLKRKLNQRSLLLLYTNFESISALHRQLPYLRRLAKEHLVVTIFFENTEMKTLLEEDAKDVRGVYYKTIAEKFTYEKKLIVKELISHGIHAVLTTPQNLTVNTINKYLELKARGLI